MTPDEMNNLKPGDIVKSKFDSRIFVVTANYGHRVTAAATIDMTNPIEWDAVNKNPKIRVVIDINKIN